MTGAEYHKGVYTGFFNVRGRGHCRKSPKSGLLQKKVLKLQMNKSGIQHKHTFEKKHE